MDQQIVSPVEPKHHDFQDAARRVEPEAQLASRTVLIQVSGEHRGLGRVDGINRIDPVLARGIVDLTRRKRG